MTLECLHQTNVLGCRSCETFETARVAVERPSPTAPEPTKPAKKKWLSAKALGEVLTVDPRAIREWIRMGVPHDVIAHGRHERRRFNEDDVRAWLRTSARSAPFMETVSRHGAGMKGQWAMFRPQGWAAISCRWHGKGETTRTREALGDYVVARVEHRRNQKHDEEWVTVRCWCSARIGRFLLAAVPLEERQSLRSVRP